MLFPQQSGADEYRNLPNVELAINFGFTRHDLIQTLCELLVRFGVQSKYGISVLHKHFDISSDEILIRRAERGRIYIEPESGVDDALACHWKVSSDTSAYKLLPIEFVHESSFAEAARLPSYLVSGKMMEEFRSEFTGMIVDAGAENEIGLMTLHAPLQLGIDLSVATLYEESNDLLRRSEIYGIDNDEIGLTDAFQALWHANTCKCGSVIASCGYHCQCKDPPR